MQQERENAVLYRQESGVIQFVGVESVFSGTLSECFNRKFQRFKFPVQAKHDIIGIWNENKHKDWEYNL